MTEEEFYSPAALLDRLRTAARECADIAERHRTAAILATELAAYVTSIPTSYVDPEDVDGDRTRPDLLTGAERSAEFKAGIASLERLALNMYAAAGVWDTEAEPIAAQIVTVQRDQHAEVDGAA